MRILIATVKYWNVELAERLRNELPGCDLRIITEKEKFNKETVFDFDPDYIFIPHWSWYIPNEITSSYDCIIFHMTDLPFGRGGSPLQNLILRGYKETKISAIRATDQMDAGDIYLKKAIGLEGDAKSIFRNMAKIIFEEMIPEIVKNRLEPLPQIGEPSYFHRRTPDQSRLQKDMELEKIYDYIRMLDAEGYPKAYLDFGEYRIEFDKAYLENEGIKANVNITRRKKDE